jgi:hypothetical protein
MRILLVIILATSRPVLGAESRHATIGSGPQHRTPRLRSESDRYHPRSHSGCRPAGASAWSVLQISWVARRGGLTICEGGTLGFSQQYCAALAHFANNRRVGGADSPFVNCRSVFRRQAPRLHDVFRPERDLRQLPIPSWLLRRYLNPGMNGGVQFLNTI